MNLPTPLPGFERVNRYWDSVENKPSAKLMPGEYYVSKKREHLVTVAGSTVAVHLSDRTGDVAGLIQFSLPHPANGERADNVFQGLEYGSHALDLLIHGMTRQGVKRSSMRAVILGASRWQDGRLPTGAATARFAGRYLWQQGIEVVDESVGGRLPCKIWASYDGEVTLRPLFLVNDTLKRREQDYYDLLGTEWLASKPSAPLVGHEGAELTFHEHRQLLDRLSLLEVYGRGHNIADIRATASIVEELETFLSDHFVREEQSELYVAFPEEFPRFKPALDRLREQHVDFLQELHGLRDLCTTAYARGTDPVPPEALRSISRKLRNHEQAEGEILQRAYTEDIGGM